MSAGAEDQELQILTHMGLPPELLTAQPGSEVLKSMPRQEGGSTWPFDDLAPEVT